ncbi:MAG: hypothetical protein ACLQUY_19600 [Ktedonobacterales bacterium]
MTSPLFDLFDDASQSQSLPPDLEALYQRLLDDGALWRETVPTMSGLDASVVSMTQQFLTRPANDSHPVLRSQPPLPSTYRATHHAGGGTVIPRSRLSRIAAIAAMVVVVSLLIAVFEVMGHGRLQSSRAAVSPTASLPKPARWQVLPQLAYSSERPDDSGPAVAPSDPSVIYEANAGRDWTSADGPQFLRRTDNAGVTWHSLPFPVPASRVHWADFVVSPLDPHTVILQIADDTLSDCPASFDVTFPGDYVICELQYFSSDGGASWNLLQTPLSNLQAQGGATFSTASAIQSQGDRLYATVACPNSGCIHIVASLDGGRTWQIVDQQLHEVAPNVCYFVTAPTGETVFAVSSNMNCVYDFRQPQNVYSLWRSDDGGTTWNRVAALPTPNLFGLLAVPSGNPSQPLLYAYMPKTLSVSQDKANLPQSNTSDQASDIYVSADGGMSWSAAPELGLATGMIPVHAPLDVLSDGTVIASFNQQGTLGNMQDINGSTLYGWKLGDTSWQQLAPPLTGSLAALSIQPGSDGSDALWVFQLAASSINGSIDSYTALRFEVVP